MHVSRTTTAICRAAYNKLFQAALSDNHYVNDVDVDMDPAGSQIFEGDFFGSYKEADFDWPEDEERDDDLEMEEEDNDNDPSMDFEQTTHTLGLPLLADMPSKQASDMRGAPQSEAHFSQHHTPTHSEAQPTPSPMDYMVEAFPGDSAGMPIEFTPHQSMFENYKRQLNSEAVYAPFTSRTDWEIARWAKIRGPSSSAVNELLQIDGVSLLFLLLL